MKITTTITQKGSLKLFADTFKDSKKISKLLLEKGNITALAAEEMKEVIKSGKNLRTLRPSTMEIRRQRREGIGSKVDLEKPKPKHLSKSLFDTGALHDSIKPTQKGVNLLTYGVHQAKGFTVSNKYRGGAMRGKTVPPRNFLVALTSKKVSTAIQKEVSKNMPKMIKEIMRVGVSVKPGG